MPFTYERTVHILDRTRMCVRAGHAANGQILEELRNTLDCIRVSQDLIRQSDDLILRTRQQLPAGPKHNRLSAA